MAANDHLQPQQFTTLHRGVAEYGADDWQGKPYKTAEEWHADASDDYPNFGTWWDGNEDTAKFYGQSVSTHMKSASGLVVSAKFPADKIREPSDSTGVRIPSGTKGEVQKVQVRHLEGWKDLPHTPGMTIQA